MKGAIIDFGAVIKSGAVIGENLIGERAIVQENTKVGNGAYVGIVVETGRNTVIGNEAFISLGTLLNSDSIVSPSKTRFKPTISTQVNPFSKISQ